MEEIVYATVCLDHLTRWDRSDSNYHYKKYVFFKVTQGDLDLAINGYVKQIPAPFTFLSVANKEEFNESLKLISVGSEEIEVLFYNGNSEVVRTEKTMFFFF